MPVTSSCFVRKLRVPLTVSLLAGAWASPTRSEDFRIETRLFQADVEEPVSENETLFENGTVYDFLESPPRTAVFRKPAGEVSGRFILLDTHREVWTELATDQVDHLITKLRSWALDHDDPWLRFAAAPDFDEQYDSKSGLLTLRSDHLVYESSTVSAEGHDGLRDYRQFSDWYARLNTLLGGQRLPFPRLALNAALAKYDVVPSSVRLQMPAQGIDVRAEHRFTWRLSKMDRMRIDTVRKQLRDFRQVTNSEFWLPPAVASK